MPLVLRWGRSAYETDEDLALERASAERLGLEWISRPALNPPDELDRADVLVVNSKVAVDAAALDRVAGDLVITTTSGADHIDIAAATERRVRVARCPMARRDAVVETSLAGLLALFREIPRLHDASERGHWARGDLPALAPVLLRESTVAVVGSAGVIGTEACLRLQALGATVLGVDPRGAPVGVPVLPLYEALARADALTLHCHLSQGTRGLIGPVELDRLRAGAVVVNTSRGDVLDVPAAIERVASGALRGVLIDVFPAEPLPELAAHASPPGVLLLPHAAGYTRDLGRRVAEEVDAALIAWVNDHPIPNRIFHRD